MKNLLAIVCALVVLISCKQEPQEMGWKFERSIPLAGINPIGLASADGGLWVSDGDHFRVVKIDLAGTIMQSIDSLDRPMHIAAYNTQLLIPQYGNDEVALYTPNDIDHILPQLVYVADSLDAPAGADFTENETAIADFYNNRILYNKFDRDQDSWISFGRQGQADGEFYYPTDVQITEDALWVADAYNNRLQKFTKEGKHLLTVGEDQNMNAATGIFVSEDQVFSTDFENDRVLVFDLNGAFVQELKQEINKPTDMLIKDGKLYVANYNSSSLSIYHWAEIKLIEEDHGDDHHHDEEEEHN